MVQRVVRYSLFCLTDIYKLQAKTKAQRASAYVYVVTRTNKRLFSKHYPLRKRRYSQ